jgi:4a-hydroxytetrahydrobiopterin dehydratase
VAPPRLPTETVIGALQTLPGWYLIGDALHARHDAPDVPTAGAVVADVLQAAEDLNHHPDIDVRYKRVRWQLSTHEAGGITQADLDLASRICEITVARGAAPLSPPSCSLTIGIDTADPARLADFWEAALGFRRVVGPDGEITLVDPAGAMPGVWFQRTDTPATGRNRLHVDVLVPHDAMAARREGVEAVGGRLVTDRFAPQWWVYADGDGNEICLCMS